MATPAEIQAAASLGMPVWMYLLYAPALPPQKNAPWTPTFAPQQFVQEPNNQGGEAVQSIPVTAFPTFATAEWLQAKYAPGGTVITTPYPGIGGPDQSVSGTLPPYYSIMWGNGVMIPASCLAAIWYQNPGQQDAADNVCQQLIDMRSAA